MKFTEEVREHLSNQYDEGIIDGNTLDPALNAFDIFEKHIEELNTTNKILFKMLSDAKDKIVKLETGRHSGIPIFSEKAKIEEEIDTELDKKLKDVKRSQQRIESQGTYEKVYYKKKYGKMITPCPYRESYHPDKICLVGSSGCDECKYFKDRIFDTNYVYCKRKSS